MTECVLIKAFKQSLSFSDVRVWCWLLEHINFDSCQARVGDTQQGQW